MPVGIGLNYVEIDYELVNYYKKRSNFFDDVTRKIGPLDFTVLIHAVNAFVITNMFFLCPLALSICTHKKRVGNISCLLFLAASKPICTQGYLGKCK